LLSANPLRLESELALLSEAGITGLHLDVMDGHFVPNLSFGPHVVKALRLQTPFWIDAHLMVTLESRLFEAFVRAGAHHITLHVEASSSLKDKLELIKTNGCGIGLSLKPSTPPESLLPFLSMLDMVLVMTVEPGFGGQSFMPDQLHKIQFLRKAIDTLGLNVRLEVDGGINAQTIPVCAESGADTFVAGASVFEYNNRDILGNLQTLHDSLRMPCP
jgi:ribulose-phosphate 3-epimerase